MNRRLALALTAIALPGVVATAWFAVPLLVDPTAADVPLRTIQVASAAQGMLLVVIAAVVGAALGPRVGVAAPAVSARLAGRSVIAALRPQWLPGILGGIFGAAVIVAFHAFAPQMLAAVQEKGAMPLAVRLLYGGITEEVLIRWGLMTLLLWAAWRLVQRGAGRPSSAVAWTAILASALVFGLSHLPSVAGLLGTVPASVVAYVTLGNAAFGVVAGYLFWRHGLEAAIIAHVLAHAFAYAIRG